MGKINEKLKEGSERKTRLIMILSGKGSGHMIVVSLKYLQS